MSLRKKKDSDAPEQGAAEEDSAVQEDNDDGAEVPDAATSAEAVSVFMLRISISTKLTTPRTIGTFRILCFLRTETNSFGMTAIDPLGRRQAVAVRVPAFIITPSRTACPPT